MEFIYSLYPYVKHTHMLFVATSVLFFVLRFVLHMRNSPLMQKKFFKVVPHVVDTFLLLTGLMLCFLIKQYPFVDPWLTEKVTGVAAYILLGVMAMRKNQNTFFKMFAFFGALGWVVYVGKIAVFKSATLLG